jgi:signal transduction histidine kinase
MAATSTERGGGVVPATALTVLGFCLIAAAVAHDVRFGTGQLLTAVVAMPGVLLLAGLVYIIWSDLSAETYWTVARWVFGSLVTLGGGVAVVVYLGGDLAGTGVGSLGGKSLQVLFFAGLGSVGGMLVGLQSVRAVEEARRAEEARTSALMFAAERDRLSQLSETSHALLKAEEERRVAELLAEGIDRAIPDATCSVWLSERSGLEPAVDGTPDNPDYAGSDGFDDDEERVVAAPDGGRRLYVPLAAHGLLAVTLPPNREFDDRSLDLVRVYARTGQTALDRAVHQEALERQNERLDEFASVVSHDLRSPLSVILGRAELALETGEIDHLDAIVESAERMDRLIEDVLTLARKGEKAADRERVGLRECAVRAWDAVGTPEASADIDDDLPVVAGDPEQLQRLFENLFRNAIEHGGEDVSVSVLPLEDGGCAVVDDGPGIPEAEREQVFERGYSTGGTGLGLAIVDDIVDAHGGHVSVTDAAGGGARIEIRDLPRSEGSFGMDSVDIDEGENDGEDGPAGDEEPDGNGDSDSRTVETPGSPENRTG